MPLKVYGTKRPTISKPGFLGHVEKEMLLVLVGPGGGKDVLPLSQYLSSWL